MYPENHYDEENARQSSDPVIQFIVTFKDSFGYGLGPNVDDVFTQGYCYYFAIMLEKAFGRGKVCLTYPDGRHAVWVDDDGKAYDITGEYSGNCSALIPFSELGDYYKVFLQRDEYLPYFDSEEEEEIFKDRLKCFARKYTRVQRMDLD